MTELAAEIEELVARALAEDVGAGDVTSEATVPEEAPGAGADRAERAGRRLRARASSPRRCASAGSSTSTTSSSRGSGARRCRPRCCWRAARRAALLAAERTAINFLGHLSGIATLTARYAEAVVGTGTTILDTRKTTPGLRRLEKAAVAAGGGHQPPHGPLRRDPDQGEPHRRSPAAWRRRSTRRATPSRRWRSRSRSATSTRPPTRSAWASTACCSTT